MNFHPRSVCTVRATGGALHEFSLVSMVVMGMNTYCLFRYTFMNTGKNFDVKFLVAKFIASAL